jgi:hypothetical protein
MLRDINKSSYIILSLILSVLALLGCTNKSQIQESGLNGLFQISEGSLFNHNNTKLPEDLSSKSFVLYGELFDTGELNLMDIYIFDGENALRRRYYVKNRVYQKPFNSVWVQVTGKYSRLDYDSDGKNEIDISNFKKLSEIDKKVEEAEDYCRDWVSKNRTFNDLNEYKQTERFKKALGDLEHIDFNKTEFKIDHSLVYFDFDKMIIGVDCGRHTLRENLQRGDYLNYLAIYDLKNEKLLKVKVVNTGYFLE